MRSLREKLCGQALKSFLLLGLWMAVGGCSPSSSSSSKSSLRINEAMAANSVVALTDNDERTVFHDWVELYNAGDATLSLNGVTLTDNPNRRTKFRFRRGLRVEPGEFKVVFVFDQSDCETDCTDDDARCQIEDCPDFDFGECMQDCNPSGFVADFDFAGGETIYLYADDGGTLLDRVGVASLGQNVYI